MESINPTNFKTNPSPGYLSCEGCHFYKNEFPNDTQCLLSNGDIEKLSHSHGSCSKNDHIYTRITNNGV